MYFANYNLKYYTAMRRSSRYVCAIIPFVTTRLTTFEPSPVTSQLQPFNRNFKTISTHFEKCDYDAHALMEDVDAIGAAIQYDVLNFDRIQKCKNDILKQKKLMEEEKLMREKERIREESLKREKERIHNEKLKRDEELRLETENMNFQFAEFNKLESFIDVLAFFEKHGTKIFEYKKEKIYIKIKELFNVGLFDSDLSDENLGLVIKYQDIFSYNPVSSNKNDTIFQNFMMRFILINKNNLTKFIYAYEKCIDHLLSDNILLFKSRIEDIFLNYLVTDNKKFLEHVHILTDSQILQLHISHPIIFTLDEALKLIKDKDIINKHINNECSKLSEDERTKFMKKYYDYLTLDTIVKYSTGDDIDMRCDNFIKFNIYVKHTDSHGKICVVPINLSRLTLHPSNLDKDISAINSRINVLVDLALEYNNEKLLARLIKQHYVTIVKHSFVNHSYNNFVTVLRFTRPHIKREQYFDFKSSIFNMYKRDNLYVYKGNCSFYNKKRKLFDAVFTT